MQNDGLEPLRDFLEEESERQTRWGARWWENPRYLEALRSGEQTAQKAS